MSADANRNRVLKKLQTFFGSFLISTIIFLAGISLKGEWLLIATHFIKQFGDPRRSIEFASNKFHNIHIYLLYSLTISYVFYFGLCGFLQWYFYIRQRDKSEEWKCQPKKFLRWEDEKFEIILGSINLGLGSIISGFISCYIINGGHTMIYYKISDYGFIYFLLSMPVCYITIDISEYYLHRMLHLPFFYKNIHKIHHRFKQPTAFSSTAMHPVEFMILESAVMIPVLFFPIHWSVYVGVMGYMFYYGIIDHSGIKMEAIWPWQPNSMFHDDHHKYFHVNFGLNLALWDKLHGTYRLKDRIYNERVFYGKGKSLKEASNEELDEYLKEN